MKNTKKNIIPVIAVLVLIVIIILFMLLGRLIEKYTPSKEHQELSEYYGLASDDSVALIFNNEVLSVQGRLILSFSIHGVFEHFFPYLSTRSTAM